jgi:hypothetical protein
VYVLKLEDSKWYIGTTERYKMRMKEHYNGIGSEWTKRYKPVSNVYKKQGNEGDEELMTLRYMHDYGIDNVRGGSFTKLILSDTEKEYALRQIRTIHNECFKCGSYSHKANECIADKDCCDLCCANDGKEIFPIYGKIGLFYAGDSSYIPCPGCQSGYSDETISDSSEDENNTKCTDIRDICSFFGKKTQ